MDIYVQKGGERHGPLSEDQIRQGIDAGVVSPDDLAWTTGKASWQPLSALIGLDVMQPPPVTASVATANIAGLREISSIPPPIGDRIEPIQVVEGRWKREHICKKCGASYKTFTLGWFKNSNVCDACIQKRNKAMSGWDPYDKTPIENGDDALRAIRNAGIFYLVLVAINLVMGVLDDSVFLGMALILLVCDLFMWIKHSRIAVITLVIVMVAGTIVNIYQGGMGAIGGSGLILALLQFTLTIKATKAIFKLHKGLHGAETNN